MRFAVIGDIHGRLDALEALLHGCGAVDEKGRWAARDFRLVQLGDLVDRGPESRACLERMMGLMAEAGEGLVQLRGNHEQMLLDSWKSRHAAEHFNMNGGDATRASYGEDFEKLCGEGGAHHRWLASLPVKFEYEGVLFVHGGIEAGHEGEADEHHLLWARPPLSRGPYRALVVGHTPTEKGRIEFKDGIFYCDTGLAYHREEKLQYLSLEIGPEALEHRVVNL